MLTPRSPANAPLAEAVINRTVAFLELGFDADRRCLPIYRLVAAAFLENRINLPQIRHLFCHFAVRRRAGDATEPRKYVAAVNDALTRLLAGEEPVSAETFDDGGEPYAR